MGRVTVFGRDACPHCTRAEDTLKRRGIPYSYIDIAQHPDRRRDMIALSNGVATVPQIFFNELHVGGADDLVKLLKDWDNESESKSTDTNNHSRIHKVHLAPDPKDPRLGPSPESPHRSAETFSELQLKKIELPDGTAATIVELLPRLERILKPHHRAFHTRWYKNCFVNTDAVDAIQNEFGIDERSATKFLRRIQLQFGLIRHVCEDHIFSNEGYLFFRLTRHHEPHILNSSIEWKRFVLSSHVHVDTDRRVVTQKVETLPPIDTLFELQRRLDQILGRHTDHAGMVDYIQVDRDPDFLTFEVASCVLQEIDLSIMDESTRKAFCLNVYNMFITYAFVKVGIATNCFRRPAFYDRIQVNLGGELLSFNDLENGILRANARHPRSVKPPFDQDRQARLSLSTLDCRIHFSLNCGAKSCPPIRFFRPDALDEELDIVSQSFCDGDDVILIQPQQRQVYLSALLKWFESDFSPTREHLPHAMLPFLRDAKFQALKSLLEHDNGRGRSSSGISIRFLPYNWSPNASRHKPFLLSDLDVNEQSLTALLHRSRQ